MRDLGESGLAPLPLSYWSFCRFSAQNCCADSAMSAFAWLARCPWDNTTNRKGCRLEPLGARVAANKMSRSTASGMGSSRYRRMALVEDRPSNRLMSVAANGVSDREGGSDWLKAKDSWLACHASEFDPMRSRTYIACCFHWVVVYFGFYFIAFFTF
jgi:hypothetical protein